MKKDIIRFVSRSLSETVVFSEKIALSISVPCVINLVGDLGSGKTTFAQGFIKALGVNDNVTSPTFTLLNEYKGKVPIYHFDMYRIENPEETQQLGFEEYFDLACLNGITLVEWAERTPHLLPKNYTQINIKAIDENSREFTVSLIQN